MNPKPLAIAAFTGILALGCEPPTPPTPGAISITLSHQTITVGRGRGGSIDVTVGRTNFDGPVRLTVEGTPPGVSAHFDSGSVVPAGRTGSVLRVTSTQQAALAVTTLTIKATAEGVATKEASFSVNIVVQGDYSLSVLHPTVTVAQGGAGSATVLVSREIFFSQRVSLALTGVPAGVTGTFDPATPDGEAELRLTATSSATPGTYSVTVTGATEGLADRTATLSLVVIAPPSTASLTFEFCASRVPIWFAFQNEGYSWQQVTGTGATFSFAATEKIGLAWVFQSPSAVEVMIHYSARSEHSPVNLPKRCSGTKSLSGSVASLASGQIAMAAMGTSSAWMNPSSTSFALQNLADGPLDLIAARGAPHGPDSPSGPAGFTPDRMIIRRSLDLASGAVMPALDFESPEAFAPAATGLTITGYDPGNLVMVRNALRSAISTWSRVHFRFTSLDVPTTLYSVPAAQLAPGDLHELTIQAYASDNLLRGHLGYFLGAADRSAALGPLVGAPSVGVVAGRPYARMRGQLAVQPEYGGAAKFIFGGLAGASRNVHVGVTAAYLGGTPSTWDVLVPDLSGTAGFQSTWMPTGGQAPAYQVDVYSTGYSALAGGFPLFRPPKDGDIIRYSIRAGPR